MKAIGLALLVLAGCPALAADEQPTALRTVPRLTAVERQRAIARLVPAYRGTPAGPFLVNPRNPVVPGFVSLSVTSAARDHTSYLTGDQTGSVLLLPNQPGEVRPNVSLALAAHARPYVIDCRVLSSEPQVAYHAETLVWGDYDTKAFEAKKSTAALTDNHVLIALPASASAQRLILGRPSGDASPTAFRMFVFFGCEITRLD